ncbi:phosphatase PAP2 family protein [Roseococcus pinisoli]|uniref:Phosphatase PAP2 family protein n=1 Tax=Roseococcus pinisoli TaxID=2835040 RepID=A0ABS5QED4_9PROT|nr:phosphatase PAP2 family protein [Roseococcus pinisoli]MBS7812070.1 phosphatase PAP2 family protein [Roseococcus pinisoli]
MRTLRAIAAEIVHLFVDGGSLALALLLWCAAIGITTFLVPAFAEVAGLGLFAGCATILFANVVLTGRSASFLRLRLARRLLGGEVALVAALLAFGVLFLAFVGLADEVIEGDMADFDQAVVMVFRHGMDLAQPIGPAWLPEAVRDVTALGSFAVLGFVLAVSLGYLLMLGQRGAALFMTASVLGGALVSTGLKQGFGRPRPDYPQLAQVFTASFPSGHALLSAVTYLTIGLLLARVTAERHLRFYFVSVAVALTLVIGISRVYLGLHYASDVLAGWSIGAAWALLCWAILLWFEQHGRVTARRPA